MLRLLMVGEADAFVKNDEELDRCKTDAARIIAEIKTLAAGELGADALMRLAVLSREARSLLELIRHYFDCRDRVHRFEGAIKGPLDADSRHALITMIEDSTA